MKPIEKLEFTDDYLILSLMTKRKNRFTMQVFSYNEQFRSEYLKMYIGMEDEKRRAVKEAVLENTRKVTEEKALSDAKALLKEGISVEVISRCVGLEIETVQQLAENLQ